MTEELESSSSRSLDDLPREVKEEIKALVAKDESAAAIQREMVQKYAQKYDAVLASESTYRKYVKELRDQLDKERTIQKAILDDSKEAQEKLKEMSSVILNVESSLDDKKAAFQRLFERLSSRIELLEQQQKQFLDPRLEAILVANRREQRLLIESMTKFQEVLGKDLEAQLTEEYRTVNQLLLAATYRVYKAHHSKTESPTFINDVAREWEVVLTNYGNAQEQMDEQKKGVS